MNIFTAIFGDPLQQQKLAGDKLALAIAKVKAARASGNKPAELAALAEMKRISSAGAAQAQAALNNVSAGDSVSAAFGSVSAAFGSVGTAAGKLLTSTPVLVGVGVLVLLAIAKK